MTVPTSDGKRVKATVGGTTTVYIGNYLEWTGSSSTMVKYIYAGGQRVAMRVGNGTTRYFLLSDHLGSTTVTANSSGATDVNNVSFNLLPHHLEALVQQTNLGEA